MADFHQLGQGWCMSGMTALGQEEPFSTRRLSGREGWIPDLHPTRSGDMVAPISAIGVTAA
jgi:hypothetical protein